MSDNVWAGLALLRLSIRCEMLEQEVAALKQQIEASKGPRAVETPSEVKADA